MRYTPEEQKTILLRCSMNRGSSWEPLDPSLYPLFSLPIAFFSSTENLTTLQCLKRPPHSLPASSRSSCFAHLSSHAIEATDWDARLARKHRRHSAVCIRPACRSALDSDWSERVDYFSTNHRVVIIYLSFIEGVSMKTGRDTVMLSSYLSNIITNAIEASDMEKNKTLCGVLLQETHQLCIGNSSAASFTQTPSQTPFQFCSRLLACVFSPPNGSLAQSLLRVKLKTCKSVS